MTSYSKLCNKNFSLKPQFTDSMTIDDTIDVSNYLQNVVLFMYVVYDMEVKRDVLFIYLPSAQLFG